MKTVKIPRHLLFFDSFEGTSGLGCWEYGPSEGQTCIGEKAEEFLCPLEATLGLDQGKLNYCKKTKNKQTTTTTN